MRRLCLRGEGSYTRVKSCTPLPFVGAMDVGGAHCVLQLPCVGRRPLEMMRAGARARDAVRAWLAGAAQLEAASVPAFEILSLELCAHAAPQALIAGVLSAAEDERRHARATARLARRAGALPAPVLVPRREPRALESIAIENAAEGLVREAYGALIAQMQSRGAHDPDVRAIYARIADDESRHAALAAAVDEWIAPRLSTAARRRVEDARVAAHARLLTECTDEPPLSLRQTLGLPDATRAVDIARMI